MLKLVFLFGTIIIMEKSYSQTFEVKSGQDLNKLVKERNGIFLTQDTETRASAYIIDDGRIIVYPAVGSKGIIVKDEQTYYQIIAKGFPIDEERPNPFQSHQSRLNSLAADAIVFINELSEKLGLALEMENDDIEYFKAIDSAVKKYGYEQFYRDLFFHFGVFIGEKYRIKHREYKWTLEKRYSYNPYFEPILKFSDTETVSPWYKLAEMLLVRKKFDIQYYLQNINY